MKLKFDFKTYLIVVLVAIIVLLIMGPAQKQLEGFASMTPGNTNISGTGPGTFGGNQFSTPYPLSLEESDIPGNWIIINETLIAKKDIIASGSQEAIDEMERIGLEESYIEEILFPSEVNVSENDTNITYVGFAFMSIEIDRFRDLIKAKTAYEEQYDIALSELDESMKASDSECGEEGVVIKADDEAVNIFRKESVLYLVISKGASEGDIDAICRALDKKFIAWNAYAV